MKLTTLLLYLSIFTLPLSAEEKLPTGSCRDSDNLVLSRGCNPYSRKFIYTPSEKERKAFREPITSKSRKVSHSYIYRDNISLQDAIEKYIDIQERQQNRKLMRSRKALSTSREREKSVEESERYEKEEMDASLYLTLKEIPREKEISDGICEIKYIVQRKKGVEDILFIDHLHPPSKIETTKRNFMKYSAPTMGILEYENRGYAILEIVYQLEKREKESETPSEKISKPY
jgi:hypothetical protein